MEETAQRKQQTLLSIACSNHSRTRTSPLFQLNLAMETFGTVAGSSISVAWQHCPDVYYKPSSKIVVVDVGGGGGSVSAAGIQTLQV